MDEKQEVRKGKAILVRFSNPPSLGRLSLPTPMAKASNIHETPVDLQKASDVDSNSGPVLESQAWEDDFFTNRYSDLGLLEPVYDMSVLAQMPEYSNILRQCIDAYKTNIFGYGVGIQYVVDVESSLYAGKKVEIDREWERLKFVYDHCSFDETLPEIMKKVIDDRETMGIGYLEVIENKKREPAGFNHVNALNMRMTVLDNEPIPVEVDVLDIDGNVITMTYYKRFRRYCQLISKGGTPIWFKQFGDPRDINRLTGDYIKDGDTNLDGSPIKKGTSIIPFRLYSSYSPYGLPRWMGMMLSLWGSRKSEELNYNYFYNGKHIPMAILINNGSLTQSSVDKLEEYSDDLKGTDNAFGWLVLEAAGFESDESYNEGSPQGVKIDMKPLTETMQTDGLFQDYDRNNRLKVRSTFRLNSLYTGESEEFTRATADTAKQLAEEQVFMPERIEMAGKFNKLINPRIGVRYVEMFLRGPFISNKEAISRALRTYTAGGAATPNMMIDALGELLDKKLEQLPTWGNVPMTILLELIKKDQSGDIMKSFKKLMDIEITEIPIDINEDPKPTLETPDDDKNTNNKPKLSIVKSEDDL